jgi:hypothetical protein
MSKESGSASDSLSGPAPICSVYSARPAYASRRCGSRRAALSGFSTEAGVSDPYG